MFKQRDLIRRCTARHSRMRTCTRSPRTCAEAGKLRLLDPPRPAPSVIHEHGVQFHAAPGTKHKTSFFADQRDNRKRLAEFCAGKRVLDLCCNSGGFGIYAKTIGGAEEVVGVDLDEEILAVAEKNARLNAFKLRFVQADIFHWLRDAKIAQSFDVVILDPAKMTRDREQVIPALKKYLDVNSTRARRDQAGRGVPDLLLHWPGQRGTVPRHAQACRVLRQPRRAGVLSVTGAGPSSVDGACAESRYLKAAFCRVDQRFQHDKRPSRADPSLRNSAPPTPSLDGSGLRP